MRNLALRILRLLWPPFIIACYLLGAAYVSGCVPLSPTLGGGQSSASLGPDSVSVTTEASTLPQRIRAGMKWLWDSYTALRAKGAVPGLEDLKNDIVDLEAVVSRGDLVAALDLYSRARARVTAIAEVAGK
jgi:hypothetical protein